MEESQRAGGRDLTKLERVEVVIAAAKSVGRPLLFALLVITVSGCSRPDAQGGALSQLEDTDFRGVVGACGHSEVEQVRLGGEAGVARTFAGWDPFVECLTSIMVYKVNAQPGNSNRSRSRRSQEVAVALKARRQKTTLKLPTSVLFFSDR